MYQQLPKNEALLRGARKRGEVAVKKTTLGEGVSDVGHACAPLFGAAWPSSMICGVE